MSEEERLFLAVTILPDVIAGIQSAIEAVTPRLRPDRLVPAENWHLTLRFFGQTAPDQRQRIIEGITELDLPPRFELKVEGWGAFPRAAAARVFWAGVEDPGGRLAHLARAVEKLAREVGFPAEHRPYKPHLTLARLRNPRDLRPLLQELPPLAVVAAVDEILLMRSRLGNGPARYEALHRFPLPASSERLTG